MLKLAKLTTSLLAKKGKSAKATQSLLRKSESPSQDASRKDYAAKVEHFYCHRQEGEISVASGFLRGEKRRDF